MFDATGSGHLNYPDFTLCASCSFAAAPRRTLVFVLTSVTNNIAAGSVTASSDLRNYTLGEPVQVTLTAGSPGQILDLEISARGPSLFCNSTSEGQCGA